MNCRDLDEVEVKNNPLSYISVNRCMADGIHTQLFWFFGGALYDQRYPRHFHVYLLADSFFSYPGFPLSKTEYRKDGGGHASGPMAYDELCLGTPAQRR